MIFKGAKVISPENDLNGIYDIRTSEGLIMDIAPEIRVKEETIDLTGKIIVPAFVEMHCHLREPGFEDKETIDTGVESAIAGGYAAICPMANTMPVNDNTEILKYIKNKNGKIGVYPVCAVTKNLTSKELTDFYGLKAFGAIAFSNDGKPIEDMEVLKEALKKAQDKDVLIISHAEDSSKSPYDNGSEYEAVKRELEAVKETDGRLHFAHISTRESLELIAEAKEDGWNVTCETAPHYFTLSKDDIVNNEARFKMNPPLRSKDDVKAVKDGLVEDVIDVIATDHAPHTFTEKTMPFDKAPMGITGFETAFSLAYTKLVKTGYMTLAHLVKKMSVNPAKILNLHNFGHIQQAFPAYFAVIDPDYEWVVDPEKFKTKCKISPYTGMKLQGKVIKTVIKDKIYDN